MLKDQFADNRTRVTLFVNAKTHYMYSLHDKITGISGITLHHGRASYTQKRKEETKEGGEEVASHPGAKGAGISFVLSFQKSQKYAILETHLNT